MKKMACKMGRSALAILLVTLTCLSPASLTAFAEDTETSDSSAAVQGISDNSEAETEIVPSDIETQVATDTTVTEETNDLATADAEALGTQEAGTAEATDEADTHVFNIGTTLDLMDAYKYDINSQSNQSFVINLTDDITLVKPTDRTDTHGNRLVIGTDRLDVKNGNTVTILGHGHTITYTDKSTNNLSLGAYANSNLILGSADGSDALTITFTGTQEVEPLLTISGGTLTINEGIVLSNNVNSTGLAGGAINIQNNGVVTMNGGLIENCRNADIPCGGGVAVDGGEFHMNGGTIKGCSEPEAFGYKGSGGAVAVGLHGESSLFAMGGDAVIEGNSALYGGGVYVGPNSTFTMTGNASIKNNTASVNGGGVYVEQGGTFTMEDTNVVIGNAAQNGGGVLNFGTANVTNVYDNDASKAGADIYNGGTITMEDVKDEWVLSRAQSTSDPSYVPGGESGASKDDTTPDLGVMKIRSIDSLDSQSLETQAKTALSTAIDGWYYDGHRETGETDADGNAVVEHNRWNANEDTADVPQYLQSYAVDGQPTTEVMGLKAAHSPVEEIPKTINVIWENYDGTELFTLVKVDASHVPAADEYEALSGNENPTEESDSTHEYEFEGWERSVESDGDVVYTAEFDAVPLVDDTPTPANPGDEPKPSSDGDHGNALKDASKGELPQTGDGNGVLVLGLGSLTAAAVMAAGFAGYRFKGSRKQER